MPRWAWAPWGEIVRTAAHNFVGTPARDADRAGGSVAFSAGARTAAVPDFDRGGGQTRTHWNRFWTTGGAIDLVRQHRSALARAGAAHRAVAVPDGHPVRGPLPAAGKRAHVQQLGGQVPSRDALVARGAVRAVGPAAAARAEPRLLRRASCRRPEPRRRARATPARAGRR